MLRGPVILSALFLALSGSAHAQLISIRTVPVAQSDQFDIYPSHNLAMGGLSLALADTLLDPFLNPAKGVRLAGGRFLGSPRLFSVTGDAGAGRTLPLAITARRGDWFGGMSLALQQVEPSQRTASPIPVPLFNVVGPQPDLVPPDRPHGNTYAFASLGRVLGETGWSVAGSFRWAGLNAVDGVDLLYAGSSSINQHGYAGDVRVGVLKQWPGDRSFEALLLLNRFRMKHDVTFLDQFWDPATQQTAQRARVQGNLDYSDALGLHLAYQRPLTATGWRMGWLLTSNVMTHPKLPEYDVRNVGIVAIPWDPGNSYAFNVGLGFAKAVEQSTFGLEVVYEPIWTYTWGEAPGPIPAANGATIPAGGKTVENWFRFSNAQFRMGVDRKSLPGLSDALGLQLGLMIHTIHYSLRQYNNVQGEWRSLEERWLEWAPTWGLTMRLPDLEIRYRGRVTHGTGRPGVSMNQGFGRANLLSADAAVGSNILVAPEGPLTLDDVSVFSHQVSLSIPLR